MSHVDDISSNLAAEVLVYVEDLEEVLGVEIMTGKQYVDIKYSTTETNHVGKKKSKVISRNVDQTKMPYTEEERSYGHIQWSQVLLQLRLCLNQSVAC